MELLRGYQSMNGDTRTLLSKRAEFTARWLGENAPECREEQKHLDAGTQEQVYWHYGYLMAIRDALKLLNRPGTFSPRV